MVRVAVVEFIDERRVVGIFNVLQFSSLRWKFITAMID